MPPRTKKRGRQGFWGRVAMIERKTAKGVSELYLADLRYWLGVFKGMHPPLKQRSCALFLCHDGGRRNALHQEGEHHQGVFWPRCIRLLQHPAEAQNLLLHPWHVRIRVGLFRTIAPRLYRHARVAMLSLRLPPLPLEEH